MNKKRKKESTESKWNIRKKEKNKNDKEEDNEETAKKQIK